MSDRRYTHAYKEIADDIQQDAESKLGRPLAVDESNAIRNAGSLMMLESVAMSMQRAETAEEVLAQIADSQSAFAERLVEARANVRSCLQSKMGRALSTTEIAVVAAIPNCLVAMLWLHNIEDAGSVSEIDEVMP